MQVGRILTISDADTHNNSLEPAEFLVNNVEILPKGQVLDVPSDLRSAMRAKLICAFQGLAAMTAESGFGLIV